MKKFILLISIVFLGKLIFAQTPCKEIVGYYPNWQWYDRSHLVDPQSIDYSKYTILNYCFLRPETDGKISLTDSWADENLLLGQHDWSQGNDTYIPNTSLVDIAHNNGVKVLPSIGGWTLSNNFPAIAADATKRATFAQECVNLIDSFKFDGIDIDWEYPGYAGHGGSAADKENFNLFLQEIRTAIDNYGSAHGKTMLLTAAVSADPAKMLDVDWAVVSQSLDIINLMTYDFYGAFDSKTNHNAPLYKPDDDFGHPGFNLDSAVTTLLNVHGVSPDKITAGVAFYGRSAKTTGAPDLFVASTGQGDTQTFSDDDGTPLYYNVLKNMNLFDEHWDDQAKVPYLTGKNDLKTFLSYDNVESIGLKAQYIVDNNLRGAIIWEITGDYIETSPGSGVLGSTPLVDKLNDVLCGYSNVSETTDNIKFSFYPNPTKGKIYINFNETQGNVQITVNSILGKQISYLEFNNTNKVSFNINSNNGLYIVRINTNKGNFKSFRIIKE